MNARRGDKERIEERKAAILAAIEAGCASGGEISQHIKNGMTRNAVIGFCHRHGIPLPQALSPTGARAERKPTVRIREPKPPKIFNHKGPVAPTPIAESKPTVLANKGDCTWYEGCGNKITRGSYCAEHAETVYAPRSETARRQRAVSRAPWRR